MPQTNETFTPAPSGFNSILRRICTMILRLSGWRYTLALPAVPKFVIIGAPHTTNWDFVLMFLITRAENLRLNWV